ncbi:MAG: carboxymuconolactone decarboxylase family protein [Bacteroidetes bacterium]|nr:carboxymuconolactone decarboxylase family protein [Bacteroidota bacterium]MBS1592102.1 carboxymuconolactone decarboxylase family protein [Bacteroidota bacterium]MBS1638517.1 carboxymuconolactone decarboxylase family protein [Bacteroidota bacterium]MBS1643075.1 carboxymuconolactone decarboxylase family protein [Bacteroidota bacterium]MBS1671804.1 carboxymuconolactone decarboxylase family protein [Bacteroidota bacterium]
MNNSNEMYPAVTAENIKQKADLAPKQIEAWRTFSRAVFKEGVLDEKTKQLIAVAVAHVTQCPYCIKSHVPQALKKGATKQEIMEAIWVAAEMRAGAAYAHATIALEAMENENK